MLSFCKPMLYQLSSWANYRSQSLPFHFFRSLQPVWYYLLWVFAILVSVLIIIYSGFVFFLFLNQVPLYFFSKVCLYPLHSSFFVCAFIQQLTFHNELSFRLTCSSLTFLCPPIPLNLLSESIIDRTFDAKKQALLHQIET